MNLDEERYRAEAGHLGDRRRQGRRPARRRTSRSATSRRRVLVQVYEAYEAQCQREGVVDFAELMLRTYELMRDNAALREHYQRRFRHILVDEFQDTNRLQYAWLKMFAGPPEHGSRCSRSATTTRASTRFAARRSATWRRSSASTASAGHQARAQLPLVRQHPRRRQRADLAQLAPPRQEPAHRGRAGRAGARARGDQRLRRGAVVRRGGAAAAPRGHAAPARSRCSTAATRRAG